MQQATVPYYKVTQFYYYGVIIEECQCKYRAPGEVLIFWYLKKVSQNILVLVWLISLSEHIRATKTLWNISKYTPIIFRPLGMSELVRGAWVCFWGLRLYKSRSGWSKSAILAQKWESKFVDRHFWDIKISKPPYICFKIIGLCILLHFCVCQREITIIIHQWSPCSRMENTGPF